MISIRIATWNLNWATRERARAAGRALRQRGGADWLPAEEAKTPEVDHPDADKGRTHWHTGRGKLEGNPGDHRLVGADPVHTLRDAYRTWLQDNPAALSAIRANAPEGPLATTIGTGENKSVEGTLGATTPSDSPRTSACSAQGMTQRMPADLA